MGSWWGIEIGKSWAPIWGERFVPDELTLLFTDNDLIIEEPPSNVLSQHDQISATDISENYSVSSEYQAVMKYSVAASVLRKRLELQGFSTQWVKKLCTAFFEDIYELSDPFDKWPEGALKYPTPNELTAALASRRGQDAAMPAALLSREDPETEFLARQWKIVREHFDDPRFWLALSLAYTRGSTVVTLDLSGLVSEAWLEYTERPHLEARSRISSRVAASGPVIVITEGTSDARWLRRALEIGAPEVAHYFEFLDFDQYSAPGGTDRVVSLTKGMAAAGVMNRIIAVLDNDTVGRQAAAQLIELKLPRRIAVMNLPRVAYAEQYPTYGPDGSSQADINGSAVTIEFMFGDEILRDPNGELYPIRWRSFIDKAAAYQGSLDKIYKSKIGARIDKALTNLEGRESDMIRDQVLEGCLRLSSRLVAAADQVRNVPATERSLLSLLWENDPFVTIYLSS